MQKTIASVLIILLFSSFAIKSKGQIREAKIVYEYTIFWNKIYTELPYLSQEEKDRELLTWGNSDGYKSKMNLFFDETRSLYTFGAANEDQTYSWRNSDFIIYRDFAEKTILEYEETLGKTYVLKDEMPAYKWRVMNKLKEIKGHMCMLAVTQDTAKGYDIEAWFAADIPVPVGPERYYGLPGAILGLDINNGSVTLEAISIETIEVDEELKLPKKMKGKEIDYIGMQSLIAEHIKTSITAQRNPYWSMRY